MRVIFDEESYRFHYGWRNPNSPLAMRPDHLSRDVLMTLNDNFPLITDFEIVLSTYKESPYPYYALFYSSEKGGNILDPIIHSWSISREGFSIPLDFNNMDQAWELNIVAGDEFVYMLESDYDAPEEGLKRWFRVPKDRYIREWQLAIEASKLLSGNETDRECLLRLAPPGQSLYNIHMLSAQEGWAVGGTFDQDGQPQSGCILHYQQGKWSAQQVDTPLFDLSFVSADDGWAVGMHGAMFHFDGEQWVRQPSITESTLRSIVIRTNKNWVVGRAVGDNGTILRYDKTGWSQDKYSLSSEKVSVPLHCVIARWSDDAWTVGDNGVIVSTMRGGWSSQYRFYQANHLNSLSLVSPSAWVWWAVGERGLIIQYRAREVHSAYRREDIRSLYSVLMLSEKDGWCFGAEGVILRYNGVDWEAQPNACHKDLRGSWMISPEEGWCVGQDNTILHYHNGVWQEEAIE